MFEVLYIMDKRLIYCIATWPPYLNLSSLVTTKEQEPSLFVPNGRNPIISHTSE